MLKVMHVITGLGRGGAEAVLTRLASATATEFQHVIVALQSEGHYGNILRSRGFTVHTLHMGYGLSLLSGTWRLSVLMKRERPDVIQTWMYHGDLIGGIAAKLAGLRPVIWGIRNTNLSVAAIRRATRTVAWLCARLSRSLPDAIACNSHESAKVHAEFGYDARRMRVIQNGYDLARFQPDPAAGAAVRAQLGLGERDLVLGMVARWDAQKDHGNLLSAVAAHIRGGSPARVLLVGDGLVATNATLGQLIEANGLSDRVVLAGPRDDVPAVMNALDVHVLSSLGEAFPNVVAEAMACGTPSVTTDVGDAAVIVGDTGWVARPRDSRALAQAIDAAVAALGSAGKQALGARARARIEENFDMTRMTAAYAALWRGARSCAE